MAEFGETIRLRVFRVIVSDVIDEHWLVCLRRIDRVWEGAAFVRWKVFWELNNSRSVRALSGEVRSSFTVDDSVLVGRSLGKIRALNSADRQCDAFGLLERDCSESKSTRRDRGDNETSDGGIEGRTEYLLRRGEDWADETEVSKQEKKTNKPSNEFRKRMIVTFICWSNGCCRFCWILSD